MLKSGTTSENKEMYKEKMESQGRKAMWKCLWTKLPTYVSRIRGDGIRRKRRENHGEELDLSGGARLAERRKHVYTEIIGLAIGLVSGFGVGLVAAKAGDYIDSTWYLTLLPLLVGDIMLLPFTPSLALGDITFILLLAARLEDDIELDYIVIFMILVGGQLAEILFRIIELKLRGEGIRIPSVVLAFTRFALLFTFLALLGLKLDETITADYEYVFVPAVLYLFMFFTAEIGFNEKGLPFLDDPRRIMTVLYYMLLSFATLVLIGVNFESTEIDPLISLGPLMSVFALDAILIVIHLIL